MRQLEAFQTAGRNTVSSRDLGGALGLSDAQVRKDLGYFGQFGHPGVGYRVPELIDQLRRILGTDKKTNALLVGVGNLGRALLSYRGFAKRGFEVVAVFDNDAAKVGVEIPGVHPLRVQSLSEMPGTIQRHDIRVGILTVPAPAAQGVAEAMAAAGIRGILNFAPVTLRVGGAVHIATVDLAEHLEQLAFQSGGVASEPDLPLRE